jgi:hypothetical protein
MLVSAALNRQKRVTSGSRTSTNIDAILILDYLLQFSINTTVKYYGKYIFKILLCLTRSLQ